MGGECLMIADSLIRDGYEIINMRITSVDLFMNIMNIVGVKRFNDMKGKYVRVAIKSMCHPVKIIGNIIEDKWFDPESFFKN